MSFLKSTLQPWELEIVESYPLIYLEKDEENTYWNKTDDYVNLRFNFECESGWASLIKEYSFAATKLVKLLRKTEQPDAYIHGCIIKSKFGGLQLQNNVNLIYPYREIFYAYTHSIEAKSYNVCELTGKFGKIRKDIGWIRTLCDEEYMKIKEKLK